MPGKHAVKASMIEASAIEFIRSSIVSTQGSCSNLCLAWSLAKSTNSDVSQGVAGDTPVPINAIVAKEIKFQGTHRFHEEFSEAVSAISVGDIDVSPIISASFQLDAIQQAFETAMNRRKSVKVHLKFN